MLKKRYFKFEPAVFNKLYSDFELNANTGDEEIEESKGFFWLFILIGIARVVSAGLSI